MESLAYRVDMQIRGYSVAPSCHLTGATGWSPPGTNGSHRWLPAVSKREPPCIIATTQFSSVQFNAV